MSPADTSAPNRREFLARAGGAAAAAGITNILPGIASHAEAHGGNDDDPSSARRRADEAFRVRQRAAQFQRRQELVEHRTNGDEGRYSNKIGSFSKALPHNGNGEVDTAAFAALVSAMDSAAESDFEAIPLGGGDRGARLVNPQGGLAFGFCGADAQASSLRTPPRFDSAEQAGEMVELYWAALTRDVPFDVYTADTTIAAAAAELSTMSDFRGPKVTGAVTPNSIFRGPTAGDLVGPFISQLLWKPVNYGPYVIDQKVRIAQPGGEFLWDYNEWLDVQNGVPPRPTRQQVVSTERRYIITTRDLAEWLHRDFSHQGGTNAVFILLASGVPLAPGNPYLAYTKQAGFVTFSTPQVLDMVAMIANLSLQACWFHKWGVHRKVRPEEFAGSVHNRLALGLPRPIHSDVLNSKALQQVQTIYGSALLPMAYAEGCPTHPAYPAGHATVAGAWATILKAFFDTGALISNPVVPNAAGDELDLYRGDLTAGNEIDKLASNVAIGRVPAGVHWRSDSVEGMNLGEACAIAVLRDMLRTWNESFVGFSFKKFDGTPIVI